MCSLMRKDPLRSLPAIPFSVAASTTSALTCAQTIRKALSRANSALSFLRGLSRGVVLDSDLSEDGAGWGNSSEAQRGVALNLFSKWLEWVQDSLGEPSGQEAFSLLLGVQGKSGPASTKVQTDSEGGQFNLAGQSSQPKRSTRLPFLRLGAARQTSSTSALVLEFF